MGFRSALQHIKIAIRLKIDRRRLSKINNSPTKLHFGCGDNIVGGGWINCDLVPQDKRIYCVDVRKPLPFESESVAYIFTEHMIEHLVKDDAEKFLAECFRVLRPGGVFRVAWPELGNIVQAYLANQPETWDTGNPLSKTVCDKINDSFYLFEHRFIWDFETMEKTLLATGFKSVERCEKNESCHEALRNMEFHDGMPGVVEATK